MTISLAKAWHSISLRADALPEKGDDDAEAGAGGDNPTVVAQLTKEPAVALTPDQQIEPDVEAGEVVEPPVDDSKYNIEFTFDSDVTCKISIMYFAREELVNGVAV